jgi:hypothetical protein
MSLYGSARINLKEVWYSKLRIEVTLPPFQRSGCRDTRYLHGRLNRRGSREGPHI